MSSSVEAAPGQNEALFKSPQDVRCGQWKQIENIKENEYVQEIGRFAVMEHNKKTGANLKFICVKSGMKQVVNGMNYLLLLEATNGRLVSHYEAEVYDNASEHSWTLKFFIPIFKN